ncbi:MAG: hypothetical protein EB060_04390 [Proteobacteria bacterium]|nr:hypothetical protein [Pseudomonadota bacterium]
MRVNGEKLKGWIDYLQVASVLRFDTMGVVMRGIPLTYDNQQAALVSSDNVGPDVLAGIKRNVDRLGFEGGITESAGEYGNVNFETVITALDTDALAPREVAAKERADTQKKLGHAAEVLEELVDKFRKELPYDQLPSTVKQALRDHTKTSTHAPIKGIRERIEGSEPERAKPHYLTLTMFDAFRLFAWANVQGSRDADLYQRFELADLEQLTERVKRVNTLIAPDRKDPIRTADVEVTALPGGGYNSVRRIAEQTKDRIDMVAELIEIASQGARKLRPSFVKLDEELKTANLVLGTALYHNSGFSDRVEDALLDTMYGMLVERKQERPNSLIDQIRQAIAGNTATFNKKTQPMFKDEIRLDETQKPARVVLLVDDTTSFDEVAKALKVARGAVGRVPKGPVHEVVVNVEILTAALGIRVGAITPLGAGEENLGQLSRDTKARLSKNLPPQ